MKTVINYLDDLKEKLGSDYKIAKAFGVDTAAISMIRKRQQMSDETALKIAKHLEIDPSEVLIAAAMARSQGEVKEAWENLGKKAGIAASLIVGIGLASFVLGYSINGLDKIDYMYGLGISTGENIHYAKSLLRKTIKKFLARIRIFVRHLKGLNHERQKAKIEFLSHP